MFARLITIVAALLLACASPQASAYVRAERVGVSFADIANSAAPETALPAQTACKSKTAPPARASLEYPASGENAALTHWHTWGNPLSPEKPTSGNRDWLWDSAPFGDTAANEQPTVGLASFTFNLRFPGQQYDRETGTHYNYFRDYEAGAGRYVQSDPIGLRGELNTFSYAYESPLDYFDPLGLNKSGGSKPPNSRRGTKCPRTSNDYKGPTGVYIMFGPDSEVHKVGETADPRVSRFGTLSRCQSQANKLNRSNGLTSLNGYRCSKVDPKKPLPLNSKPQAKCVQYCLANTFRSGGHSLPGMQPIPNPL